MIDMHSHILPNIDDGAKNIDKSITMIKEAYEAGFTDIISTSHYIEESYNATKKEREKLIRDINKKLEAENISIKIHNGAEAYVSINLVDLIESEKLPTINESKYLLMELPMHSEIIYLDEIIYKLKNNGIIPIIAHPERYLYVQENPKVLQSLIDKGVLFQANYGSVIGHYGKSAKKTLKKLLKNDMIHFFGTDTHRSGSIYTQMDSILRKLERIIGKEKLYVLSKINPQRVLDNKEIV